MTRLARAAATWFAPPELTRPDLRRRARALWIVSWPFFALVAVVLGIAVVIEPHTLARRATTVAAVGALVLVLHTISRAGRPVLASWILVVGLCLIVTQRAWITGGIHAPVAVFYALFVLMGERAAGPPRRRDDRLDVRGWRGRPYHSVGNRGGGAARRSRP